MRGANRPAFAGMYESELVQPLFAPWADIVLDQLALTPSSRLLDLACGTGIVARRARARLGDQLRVTGIDASSQMLAVAREIAPGVDWGEGTAESLPFSDAERFDAIACQQGLQFFPDKAAAVAEMRRVLAPGGRLAIAVWRPIDEVPLFHDLQQVAERHVGAITDQRHSFGDAVALEQLLAGAGFTAVRVQTHSLTIRISRVDAFLRMNTMAVISMSANGGMLTPDGKVSVVESIIRESAPALRPYTTTGGLAFDLQSNIATAANG